jgi:hypothetical protein
MRKLKVAIAAFACTAASGIAHASNWVPLSVITKEGRFMVDADSIVNESNGAVRAWFMESRTSPGALRNGTVYDSRKFIDRFYCRTRLISSGPTHWYKEGSVVYSEPGYSKPEEIVPDSVGEGLFDALCTKKNLSSM